MQQEIFGRCRSKSASSKCIPLPGLLRQVRLGSIPVSRGIFVLRLFFLFALATSALVGPEVAKAQDYLINSTLYTWEDGLPHRQINATIKDELGLIWIATRAGVSRFDGYEFRNWTKIDDGLSSNEIGRIAQDKQGYIWAMSMPAYRENMLAIDLIDPLTRAVLDFNDVYPFRWPFAISQLSSFFHDTDTDRFYFGVNQPNGILSFHPDEGFSFFAAPEDVSIYALIGYDQAQTWWVQTEQGRIIAFTTDGRIQGRYQGPSKIVHYTHSYQPNVISWISHSPQGDSLVLITELGKATRIPLKNNNLRESSYALSLLASLPKETLSLTETVDLLSSSVSSIHHPFLDKNELVISTQIKDVLIEDQGLVWLSTDAGLVRMEWSPPLFRTWAPTPAVDQDLIRALASVEDSLILVNAEISGTFLLNPYTLESERLYNNDSLHLCIALALEGQQLSYSRREILYYGELNNPLTQVGKVPEKIWGIYPGFGDHYLITTTAGLFLFDPAQEQISNYPGYNDFPELSKVQISFAGKDRIGNWWLCANTGLYQIHPTKGVLQRYWSGGENGFFIPDDNIYHFYQDKRGIFWLSSAGGGLIRWDPSQKQTKQFTRANGIAADFVYAAYEDQDHMLWLPTDYGLTLFDKEQQRVIRTFTPKDGLSHHEFNRTSYLQLPDGTLCFGTVRGLNIFHPEELKTAGSERLPQMLVTDYSVFDNKAGTLVNRHPEFAEAPQIILKPNTSFARIEFALLNYIATDRVQYATRITPEETDWTYQKERSLRLGGLAYGEHELIIRGQKPNGQWSPHELRIPIIVRRPIYLTSWFILLSAGLLITLILSFLQWRTWNYRKNELRLKKAVDKQTATIRQQAEELQQLDQLKSRLFANVSHELRTPLTMIIGPISSMIKQDELTEKQRALLRSAHRNGKDLLRLINNILDLSKMDAGKLQVQETEISLYPFLKRIMANFQSYADRLQLTLELDYPLDHQLTLLVDQDKLTTILRNYLSNALKNTPSGGEIRMILREQDDQLLVEIKDTGDGIHPDDLPHVFDRFYQSKLSNRSTSGGTGIGLALCRELARVIEGRVWAKSQLKEGSQFFLEFPKKEVAKRLVKEPLPQPDTLGSQAKQLVGNNMYTGTKPRILVVEDNPNLQDYLQQLLSPHYDVQLASDGLMALELMGRTTTGDIARATSNTILPDVILSDVMMPRMDGLTFIHTMKQQADLAALPIIMLTALAEHPSKLDALRVGVDDYLLKPFDEEELLVRTANAFHRTQLRKEANALARVDAQTSELHTSSGRELRVADQEWLSELEQKARKLLESPNYNLDYLSSQLFISRRQLQRKIKQLTGLTPKAYIKEIRLQEARQLLESRQTDSVKATAIAVGMKDVENFSKQFYQRFGKRPSAYL